MSATSHDELKRLGVETARRILGETPGSGVEVSAGSDPEGRPAYFFNFRWDRDRDRRKAALLRVRLTQALRDSLISRGDGRYPYVRIAG